MPDPRADPVDSADALHFLTLRVNERRYALRAEDVAEIVRVPAMARVPQSPRALLGIANLRGSVLPVVSLRALLGLAPISGQLPITIPSVAPYGAGLRREARAASASSAAPVP